MARPPRFERRSGGTSSFFSGRIPSNNVRPWRRGLGYAIDKKKQSCDALHPPHQIGEAVGAEPFHKRPCSPVSGEKASPDEVSDVGDITPDPETALQEIWCNDDGDPGKAFWVNCMIAAGRDESDFYDALGIVGAGPIGSYTGKRRTATRPAD
jgi:hypothetical protein